MSSSTSKPPLASKPTSSRLPPPALFQGPPSRNASNISLLPPPPTGGLLPSHSPRDVPSDKSNLLHPSSAGAGGVAAPPPSSPVEARSRPYRRQSQLTAQSENDRADALWMEMQNTLAEVELSAENTGHAFGSEHGQALEELRSAQLALAQAWARSESEEVNLDGAQTAKNPAMAGASAKATPAGESEKAKPPASQNVSGATGGGNADDDIQEESEMDILMARKRREANDRYFQRVNQGVLDVVAKLEGVALAMRKVEKESRDIWSETESIATTEETSAG